MKHPWDLRCCSGTLKSQKKFEKLTRSIDLRIIKIPAKKLLQSNEKITKLAKTSQKLKLVTHWTTNNYGIIWVRASWGTSLERSESPFVLKISQTQICFTVLKKTAYKVHYSYLRPHFLPVAPTTQKSVQVANNLSRFQACIIINQESRPLSTHLPLLSEARIARTPLVFSILLLVCREKSLQEKVLNDII